MVDKFMYSPSPLSQLYPQLVTDIAAAFTRAEALAVGLRKLRAELSDLQVEAVRESLGNSNAAALRLRIAEADDLLAAWRARDEATT